MNLPKDFAQKLAAMEDEQLFDMLAHSEDYLTEALDAARQEISLRGLDAAAVASLRAAAREKVRLEREELEHSNHRSGGLSIAVHFLIAAVIYGLSWLRDLLVN
jgi:hypothetical protein